MLIGTDENITYYSFYNLERFGYLHDEFLKIKNVNYSGNEIIKKTASFISDKKNIYIDTSDGVNEDLKIQEYTGRIKRAIINSKGKPFVFFKSAYSSKWSKNIIDLANNNNGKVIPFFKWSFNKNFYNQIFNNRSKILSKYTKNNKKYDIGVFFGKKDYRYPKPSESDVYISHSDHKTFGIPGFSRDTGYFINNSRSNLINKLNNSKFKILHTAVPYEEYIKKSFECKIIINPPGIGEYTSRMFDQAYLGNCIVLRKNSYDNGSSWKNYLPEVDFNDSNWENDLELLINNHKSQGDLCKKYFDNFWTPKSILEYFMKSLNRK